MKHARPDYDLIQDPRGIIPADEPVMLFRAQDTYAIVALRAYLHKLTLENADPRMIEAIEEQIDRFAAWKRKKVPDLPVINPKQTVKAQ